MMLNSLEDMVTGIKLNKQLYNNSINEKLTKQNLQTNLTEIYKPLLTDQEQQLKETEKIKPAIITGTREITDRLDIDAADAAQRHTDIARQHTATYKYNYIVDLAKVARKHPNIVNAYKGIMDPEDLPQDERDIIKKFNALKDDNLKMLIDLIISTESPEYTTDSGEDTKDENKTTEDAAEAARADQAAGGQDVLSGEELYDNITRYSTREMKMDQLVPYMKNRFADTVDDDADTIEYKSNNRKKLIAYMKENDFRTNASMNIWRAIREVNPAFYAELPNPPIYLKETTSFSAKKKKER
jgi:hypothetical protein